MYIHIYKHTHKYKTHVYLISNQITFVKYFMYMCAKVDVRGQPEGVSSIMGMGPGRQTHAIKHSGKPFATFYLNTMEN